MRGNKSSFHRDPEIIENNNSTRLASLTPDWVKDYEENLKKISVQSITEDRNMYDQLSSIINNKSKFSTVDEAVNDLAERTGLGTYLKQMRASNELSNESDIKTAATIIKGQRYVVAIEIDETAIKNTEGIAVPKVVSKFDNMESYIRNIVTTRFGNTHSAAIIPELTGLYAQDGFSSADENDPELKEFISNLIIEEKKLHPGNPVHPDMGKIDIGSGKNTGNDSPLGILEPAKF